MIYQNDPRVVAARPYLAKYGCGFLSLAYYRERYEARPWKLADLYAAWDEALDTGTISGDLNLDGDLDDGGECEIQDWTALCRILRLPLVCIDGHFDPFDPLIKPFYSVCAWYNPRTRYTHFVVGTSRPVNFDPIAGGSITVREGAPKNDGLRVFQLI